MKVNVLAVRMCYGGIERKEVGNWLVRMAVQMETHPQVQDTKHIPIDHCPTPAARNLAVKMMQELDCDVLFMVDADMDPAPEFGAVALDHLLHLGTGIIGSPYVGGPPKEEVQVCRWTTRESGTISAQHTDMEKYSRYEAARATGIEQVAAVGSGFIAIHKNAIRDLTPPYFFYEYQNEEEIDLASTEEIPFIRDAALQGVPVFVHWDHWSGHFKSKRCGKPDVVDMKEVPGRLLRHAGLNSPEQEPIAPALPPVLVPAKRAKFNGKQVQFPVG